MANIIYSKEVENMCVVAQGPNHGPAPLPEEGKWIQAKPSFATVHRSFSMA